MTITTPNTGWIIVRVGMFAAIEDRKKYADLMSPVLEQPTFAGFLRDAVLHRQGFWARSYLS